MAQRPSSGRGRLTAGGARVQVLPARPAPLCTHAAGRDALPLDDLQTPAPGLPWPAQLSICILSFHAVQG